MTQSFCHLPEEGNEAGQNNGGKTIGKPHNQGLEEHEAQQGFVTLRVLLIFVV
ncbi:MAG: hypothetical protein AAFX06_27720 [Planctomycetota bacterium]